METCTPTPEKTLGREVWRGDSEYYILVRLRAACTCTPCRALARQTSLRERWNGEETFRFGSTSSIDRSSLTSRKAETLALMTARQNQAQGQTGPEKSRVYVPLHVGDKQPCPCVAWWSNSTVAPRDCGDVVFVFVSCVVRSLELL